MNAQQRTRFFTENHAEEDKALRAVTAKCFVWNRTNTPKRTKPSHGDNGQRHGKDIVLRVEPNEDTIEDKALRTETSDKDTVKTSSWIPNETPHKIHLRAENRM